MQQCGSIVHATALCLSVHLSQAGTVSKQLNKLSLCLHTGCPQPILHCSETEFEYL